MTPAAPAQLAQQLVGASVSAVWRGAGTTLFVELGALRPAGRHPRGEQTIQIDWSWRIQSEAAVLVGTFSDDDAIEQVPRLLLGRRVKSIGFFGGLPELEVVLSGGLRLLSFATAEGDPAWSVRVGEQHLYVEQGRMVLGR